jgi:PIN domain nuclease of toxin-antitoxin system
VTLLLDAYAVLALLKGEPAAAHVERLLESDDPGTLTALGVAEVLDHLVRLAGAAEEDAALDVAQLGLATPDPIDGKLAARAGLLRARNYHRRDRAVSLADCVLAETARARRSPVASSDPHLLDMCRDEGIDVVMLPDSHGKTWSP